jgi:hypothetical protein
VRLLMEEGMVDKWCEFYRAAGGVCGMLLQQKGAHSRHMEEVSEF